MNPETSNMQIVAYPDMSEMPEETLQKLAAKEREWFGYGMEGAGFGEYAICSNPECRRILSVEDAYPQVNEATGKYIPLAELEKDGINLPCCPDCSGPMEPLLDPAFFPEYLRLYFSQKVYGALLMDGEEVLGSVSAFTAPFEMAFEDNINYREGYDIDNVIERISKLTNRTPDEIRNQVVVCCNRIAIDHSARGNKLIPELINKTLSINPENDDLPFIADVKRPGNLYGMFNAYSAHPIQEDEFRGSFIYAEETSQIREGTGLSNEEFEKRLKQIAEKIKRNQQERLQEEGLKPFHAIGVPLLREVFGNQGEMRGNTLFNVFENHEGKKFQVEVFDSDTVNEEKLKQFTNTFRLIFNNKFSGQFLVHPSTVKPISVKDVLSLKAEQLLEIFDLNPKELEELLEALKANPKQLVDLNILDRCNPDKYPKNPGTHESAVFWHNPEKVLEIFKEKAKKNAHFAVIKRLDIEKEVGSPDTEYAGIMFGRKCTIRELFESEEWENPILYSGIRVPENLRDFDDFLNKLNEKLIANAYEPVNEDSEVYGWNCIATHPDVRGLEHLMRLTTAFFNSIPKKMINELMVIGETQVSSRAHLLFQTAGGLDITGVLTESDEVQNGDPVIIVGPLKRAYKNFAIPLEMFV